MHHGIRLSLGFVTALTLSGCSEGGAGRRGDEGDLAEGLPVPSVECAATPSPFLHRTTSPDIAIGNLDAKIDALSGMVERSPADLSFRALLVGSLLSRTQFAGSFSDFDQAARVATLEGDLAGAPEGLELRASVAGATHHFEDALVNLARATELDGLPRDGQRATLLLALERELEWVHRSRQDAALSAPSYETWSSLAAVQAVLGLYDAADASFVRALESYRDTSPLAVAWVAFQRGVMWSEMAGCTARGKALYEEAVQRLPTYVSANVHLAELERASDAARAAERLERVYLQTEDPEPRGVLASILADTAPPRAAELARDAGARYDTLLAGPHRAAFLDHAAEFFSGIGGAPARGLALAEENLAQRPTGRAHLVALRAAIASGADARACELATLSSGSKLFPWIELSASVLPRCL